MLGLVCLQTQFIAFLFVLDWNFRFQMVLAHAINRYGEPVVGQKTRCFGHQRTSIGNVPCNVWFFNENRSLKLFIKHHPPATNHLISIERLWSKIWPIFWPKVVFHRPMNALVYQTEVLPQNVFNFICIFLQIMIRDQFDIVQACTSSISLCKSNNQFNFHRLCSRTSNLKF